MRRERARYAGLALATIACGLVVHLVGGAPKPAWRDVLGDALWAAMIVWWVAAIAPRLRDAPRAAVAYGICAAVELSQRYHTPALDAVRGSAVGHLVLGSGFDPRDLVAYGAGVLFATFVDRRRRSRGHAVAPSLPRRDRS